MNATRSININGIEYEVKDGEARSKIEGVADEFSILSSYNTGDICWYLNNLYQCDLSTNPGILPSNTTYWHQTKLHDFFGKSNSLLTNRVNTLIDEKVGDVNAVLAAALDGSEVA